MTIWSEMIAYRFDSLYYDGLRNKKKDFIVYSWMLCGFRVALPHWSHSLLL